MEKSNEDKILQFHPLIQPLFDNAVEFVNIANKTRETWQDIQRDTFYEQSLNTYVHQYESFKNASTEIIELMNRAEEYAEGLTKSFSGMGTIIGNTRFVSILDVSTVVRREFSKLFSGDGWGS